jgi:hypothetical protein
MDLEHMSALEAVSRFFPAGTHYDRVAAKRFIKWLEHCGYEIAPMRGPSLVPADQEADRQSLAAHS